MNKTKWQNKIIQQEHKGQTVVSFKALMVFLYKSNVKVNVAVYSPGPDVVM